MRSKKDILVEIIRRKSQREAARLAGEFARAASEEREEILAAMEIERWLAVQPLFTSKPFISSTFSTSFLPKSQQAFSDLTTPACSLFD